MMWYQISIFLLILFPSLAYAFQCYRCYGNSFCNEGITDNTFLNQTHNDTCEDIFATYEGSNHAIHKAIAEINKKLNLDNDNGNVASRNNTTDERFGCLTATVHEARETHTLRMCITNATIYCEALANTLFPASGSYPGVGFSCNTCRTTLCNTQRLSSGADRTFVTSIYSLLALFVFLHVH